MTCCIREIALPRGQRLPILQRGQQTELLHIELLLGLGVLMKCCPQDLRLP